MIFVLNILAFVILGLVLWVLLRKPETNPSQPMLIVDMTSVEDNNHCCWKHLGNKMRTFMILCPKCGNKRCPKATDCSLDCTNSNEPGQPGSIYGVPVDRQ